MAKRLVVFDLDGTLVDSTQDLASAVNSALREIAPGVPPLPVTLVRSLIGNGARSLIEGSLDLLLGLGGQRRGDADQRRHHPEAPDERCDSRSHVNRLPTGG